MKVNIKKLMQEPILEYQKFHEKIKLKSNQKIKDMSDWPSTWIQVFFKGYPRFEEILLPKPLVPKTSLGNVLFERKSSRTFTKKTINLEKISSLLYFSAGLRKKSEEQRGNRFYPSGGARYPLEVYVVSLNTDLAKGIYHYYLKTNSLEKLAEIEEFDFGEYFVYEDIINPAFLIIITAVFPRSTIKYRDRGYMHTLIEAGALLQNFYLNASALSLGICGLGGFFDDKFNDLLDLDGQSETTIMTLVSGEMAV